jgi:hypothetical protein
MCPFIYQGENMSTLEELKLVTVTKPTKLPAVVQRRNKLSDKLSEQIQLAKAKNSGTIYAPLISKRLKDLEGNIKTLEVPKRIKPWWFTAQNGKSCLVVRYGSKTLEIAQGKTAIELDKPDELIHTLEMIKAAVEAGELDGQIEKVAGLLKEGFLK